MELVGVSAESGLGVGARERLFARCRLGDRAAMERLVAGAQPKLFGIAYSVTRSPEDAQDAVQETFLRFLDRREEIRDPGAMLSWLCKTAVNVAIDLLRRRKVRLASALPEGDLIPAPVPDVEIESREEARELGAILLGLADELSPQQRLAFLLRDVRGLPLPEVAEILECTTSAVKAHLCLARGKLRAWIRARHPEYVE